MSEPQIDIPKPPQTLAKPDYLSVATNALAAARKKIGPYDWRGTAFEFGGVLHDWLSESKGTAARLANFVNAIENSSATNGFFRGKISQEVLEKLILTYVYSMGVNEIKPSRTSFSADPPAEWKSANWQLAQAITAHYPSSINPFESIMVTTNELANATERGQIARMKEELDKKLTEGEEPNGPRSIPVIEPKKVGIDLPKQYEKLSFRQALGTLVLAK